MSIVQWVKSFRPEMLSSQIRVVYKTLCWSCERVYISETGRSTIKNVGLPVLLMFFCKLVITWDCNYYFGLLRVQYKVVPLEVQPFFSALYLHSFFLVLLSFLYILVLSMRGFLNGAKKWPQNKSANKF